MIQPLTRPVATPRNERMDRLSAERHRLQAELEELTRLRVRLESNSAQSRSYQASLETEHAQLSAHLAKVQSRHHELTAQAQRINRELAEADRDLQPLLAAVQTSRERVQEVHTELQRAETVLGRTEDSSAELRRTIERIDAEMTFLNTQSQAASRGEVLERPRDLESGSGLWAVALARARANVEEADEAARSAAAFARNEVARDPSPESAVPDLAESASSTETLLEIRPEITAEIEVQDPPAPARQPDVDTGSFAPVRGRPLQLVAAAVAAVLVGATAAYLLLQSGEDSEPRPAPVPRPTVVISAEVEPEPAPAPAGGPDVTPSAKPEVAPPTPIELEDESVSLHPAEPTQAEAAADPSPPSSDGVAAAAPEPDEP